MSPRPAFALIALLLVVAACGDDTQQPADSTTVATSGTSATSTTVTTVSAEQPTTTPPEPVDLASIVTGAGVSFPGLSPVPGESGEVTTDIFPPDSPLRELLEGFGVSAGYATVFASEDGGQTVVVAAVEFSSSQGAADALAEFESVRDEIDATAAPFVLAVTGDPLLGSCASIDLLEQTDAVLTVWLDTSGCHGEDAEIGELVCPPQLAVDGSAVVTVAVPSHYEPFAWHTDSDHLFWIEDSQLVLGEQTEIEQEVRLTITVTDEFTVAGTDADLKAIFTTFSDITAFGDTYRLGGPRIEAECTIDIVEAAP